MYQDLVEFNLRQQNRILVLLQISTLYFVHSALYNFLLPLEFMAFLPFI